MFSKEGASFEKLTLTLLYQTTASWRSLHEPEREREATSDDETSYLKFVPAAFSSLHTILYKDDPL